MSNYCEIIDEALENCDTKKIKMVLDKIYLSGMYDEELFSEVSQMFVDGIVSRLNKKDDNQKYYVDLLLNVQKRYGFVNGGSILFDYTPNNSKDLEILLSIKKIKNDFEMNKKFVLGLGEYFLPRYIYPVNLQDSNFINALKIKYPDLANNKTDVGFDR